VEHVLFETAIHTNACSTIGRVLVPSSQNLRHLSHNTRIARPWVPMHPATTSILLGYTVSWALHPRPSALHTFTEKVWSRTCPSVCIFPCIVDGHLSTSCSVDYPDCSACRCRSRTSCFFVHGYCHSRADLSSILPYRERLPQTRFSLPAIPTPCSKNKRSRTALAIVL
jgi:hypothetical protein